jgi:hypothetical protein
MHGFYHSFLIALASGLIARLKESGGMRVSGQGTQSFVATTAIVTTLARIWAIAPNNAT